MSRFALSAVGVDRPGIVAGVTGVLTGEGCNIQDSSMSILDGHFAMMLVVEMPGDQSPAVLDAALRPLAAELGLSVGVWPIAPQAAVQPAGTELSVSVHGADRPGIVHRVSSLLAERSVNIVGLTTRLFGGGTEPVYVMTLDVVVPGTTDVASLGADLENLASDLGVVCSMHPAEADVL